MEKRGYSASIQPIKGKKRSYSIDLSQKAEKKGQRKKKRLDIGRLWAVSERAV